MLRDILVLVLLVGSAAGCVFLIAAARLVPSFARRGPRPHHSAPAVTILKPLHGDEPGLFDNLASFCRQEYSGPVQIVFGVTDRADPAIGVVEDLRAEFPDRTLDLVIDARLAGSNPKVANLINMSARIRHGIVIVADSDIRVRSDYLARVVGAIEQSGGAATCLYFGVSNESVWSLLSRLHIDSHFLPSIVVGLRLKLTQPCFGSTIAMRSASLAAIGGFAAFADCLADDFEIGAALRRRGEPVEVLPMAVGHACNEASWRELWRHELRWALTIRTINPAGYLGWLLSHPFPLALLALALDGGAAALALAIVAFACRGAILTAVERSYGVPAHPYWLIPVRDLLSFAVFVAGFVARGVDWKGHRYRLMSKGALKSERRSPSP